MAWTVNVSIGNERSDLVYINATYTDEAGNSVTINDVCAVGHYDSLLGAAKKTLDLYNTKRETINKEASKIADLLNNDVEVTLSADSVSSKAPPTSTVTVTKP